MKEAKYKIIKSVSAVRLSGIFNYMDFQSLLYGLKLHVSEIVDVHFEIWDDVRFFKFLAQTV